MSQGVIQDVLECFIDELPDDLRIVLVACAVEGMTPAQFGALFALTSETVERRMCNARSLLVEALVRRFGPSYGGVYQLN